MAAEDKTDIANKHVAKALDDLQDVVDNLQIAEQNLTYRSFSADIVSECQRMIYLIKNKLEVVSSITEKVF